MLAKTDLRDRMRAISERMRKPEAREKALKLVSNFVAKH